MAFTAEQIARAFAQNGGLVPSAGFNPSGIYEGVLPSMGGGNPALNAINAATPTAPMAPASWMAYEGGVPVASSVGGAPMPSMPRPRPASAPSRIDMAAINAPQAVTRVSGQMHPESSGGLLDLLLGKSKNGLGGLAGLLGGPQQGGLLQMLLGGRKPGVAGTIARAPAALTPAQRYAMANSGPGSVAAMEQQHSGRPVGSYSGGPAVGGEYGGGASNSGNAFEGGNYQYRGR